MFLSFDRVRNLQNLLRAATGSVGFVGLRNGFSTLGGLALREFSGGVMEDVIDEFQFADWRDLPSTLTASEVAVVLRLDADTVYRSALAGGIPGRKVGRQWRFSRDEIIRWWASD